jgi:hypothetical protein
MELEAKLGINSNGLRTADTERFAPDYLRFFTPEMETILEGHCDLV